MITWKDVAHAARLLADAPLIRAWCESVRIAAATRSASGSSSLPPPDGAVSDPTLQAVLYLEDHADYQYARRFVRYAERLPVEVRWAIFTADAHGDVTALSPAARAVVAEIAECFPEHPLDRAD